MRNPNIPKNEKTPSADESSEIDKIYQISKKELKKQIEDITKDKNRLNEIKSNYGELLKEYETLNSVNAMMLVDQEQDLISLNLATIFFCSTISFCKTQ